METQHLVWAVFSTSVVGFFSLLTMILKNNEAVLKEFRKLNKALIGDYDESGKYVEGIVPVVHGMKKECDRRKDECKNSHGGK